MGTATITGGIARSIAQHRCTQVTIVSSDPVTRAIAVARAHGLERVCLQQPGIMAAPVPRDTIDILKDDDTILRKMFLDVLKHHHEDLSGKLDEIFAKADRWCETQEQSDFDELEKYLEEMLPSEHILVCFLVPLLCRASASRYQALCLLVALPCATDTPPTSTPGAALQQYISHHLEY